MVKAIPTILLLILLYFYLKAMLFGPLEKVLKQRDELTDGARKAADASLATAERKQQEYERKFAEARAEVYRAQEDTRRKWLDDQGDQLGGARSQADTLVRSEKARIVVEAAAARENLTASSAGLAENIADAILSRKSGDVR
jgi:F-type H+-transporting ATPase subunit b